MNTAIAFWRARLGRPLTDAFHAPAMMTMQSPSGMPPGFVLRRAPMFQQLADGAERRSILGSIRSPVDLLGEVVLKGGRRQAILIPLYYGLSGELTPAETELLQQRHAQQMDEFEQCLAQTHPALLELTMKGADPVRVLSILVRYGPRKGTDLPPIQRITIRATDFELTLPHGKRVLPAASLAKLANGVPIPARFVARVRPPVPSRARRRPPGPAEMPISVAMALLWRYLNTTTGRPRRKEIAKLFHVWAPQLRAGHFDGTLVSKRVHRVERKHNSVLRDRLRYERDLEAAERVHFIGYIFPVR